MKWWADHMQVSGTNFLIPHSFNPKSPYDSDCPPYFYNGGFEPRWPLYRVFADYTSRLSLMLTGGRHVCPVALLFVGQSARVGRAVLPDDLSTALQDAQFDCDWLPYQVFERDCRVNGKNLQLHAEQYKVLVVPPVEVIPTATLAKVKEFFEMGGVVVGYGFLPSKSATLGSDSKEIAALRDAIWGPNATTGVNCCKTNSAGGRSYFLNEKPTISELQRALSIDAGVQPVLEVLAGQNSDWLHALHRVKDGRDLFLVCNQNHQGDAQEFKFRVIASGVPECWDAVRNEIASIPFERKGDAVEFSLTMEPLESTLIVFQPKALDRPARIGNAVVAVHDPVTLSRDANPEPPKSSTPPTRKEDADRSLNDCSWVWFPEIESGLNVPPGNRYFRKTIAIPADRKIKNARAILTADNKAELFVNGQAMGSIDSWNSLLEADFAKNIHPGDNVLAVLAVNGGKTPNPAGVIGRYSIELEDGSSISGTIDKTWKTAKELQDGWNRQPFDDAAWPAAQEIAKMGDAPWGQIGRELTRSPVKAADPFRSHFTIPADIDLAKTRVFLAMDELPDASAAIHVNGVYAGGVIGRPSCIDITRHLKKDGENTVVIEPLAPKSARLVFYSNAAAP
jgi:hypothetical protein